MTDHKQKGTLEKNWTKIINGTEETTGIYVHDTRNLNSEADLSIQTEQQTPKDCPTTSTDSRRKGGETSKTSGFTDWQLGKTLIRNTPLCLNKIKFILANNNLLQFVGIGYISRLTNKRHLQARR